MVDLKAIFCKFISCGIVLTAAYQYGTPCIYNTQARIDLETFLFPISLNLETFFTTVNYLFSDGITEAFCLDDLRFIDSFDNW